MLWPCSSDCKRALQKITRLETQMAEERYRLRWGSDPCHNPYLSLVCVSVYVYVRLCVCVSVYLCADVYHCAGLTIWPCVLVHVYISTCPSVFVCLSLCCGLGACASLLSVQLGAHLRSYGNTPLDNAERRKSHCRKTPEKAGKSRKRREFAMSENAVFVDLRLSELCHLSGL